MSQAVCNNTGGLGPPIQHIGSTEDKKKFNALYT